MAIKIPGVVYNGIPAQLQPGDTIDLSSPGAIGSTTPANGTFVVATANSVVSLFGVFDNVGFFGFDGVGTNFSAGNLSIFTGRSTGNATPPDIIFGNSTIGSSGSALQAAATRMRLTGSGNLVINGTDNGTDRLQVNGTGLFTGQLKANASIGSTSPTTGALVVPGGVGVGGRLSALNITVSGTGASTTPTTGAMLCSLGGLGVNGQVSAVRLYATTTLRINGSIFTISSTAPSSPVTGDQWLEVNGSNLPLYGWWWNWNGTYWLSPDERVESDFRGITVESAAFIALRSGFNYFFKSLNISRLGSVTQDGTNNWTIALNRKDTDANNTAIGSSSSNGNAAAKWFAATVTINTHVNVSATAAIGFEFRAVPAAVPGFMNAGVQAVYNLARL